MTRSVLVDICHHSFYVICPVEREMKNGEQGVAYQNGARHIGCLLDCPIRGPVPYCLCLSGEAGDSGSAGGRQ